MTFTAVGSLQAGENSVASTTTTFALTTTTPGDFVLAEFCCNTSYASNVTSSRCTWAQLAPASGAASFAYNSPFNSNVWIGSVNSAGSDTITVTFHASMGGGNCRFDGHEFGSSVGSWALDVYGALNNSGGTNTWPTLTPAGAGELYWGWSENAGSSVAGSTSGFVYQPDGNGNGSGYCLSVSSAYTPVWGDSGQVAGVMVLVKETTAAAAPPAALVSARPPAALIRASVY